MAKAGLVKPITFAQEANGSLPNADYSPEDASETFKQGNGVKFDASGRIVAAAIGDMFEGFAIQDGQNLTTAGTKDAGYIRVREGRKVIATLPAALTAAHRNTTCGFAVDATTGYWVVDTAAAVKNWVIKGWSSVWAIGDTNSRVVLEPLDAATA